MRTLALLLLLVLPFPVAAEQDVTSRAMGFSQIWKPLKRPIEDTWETPFTDAKENTLLTYAKARGILDDHASFGPDQPLHLTDALIWLFRSRNVAYPTAITAYSIADYVERHALLPDPSEALSENPPVSSAELASLIRKLDEYLKNEQHIVSFYSEDFAGLNTAFGELFDPNAMTAAHRTFPHNTLVRVTDTNTDKSVVVRINDRGPYIDGRSMDLSRAAFQRLASLGNGLLHAVTFERLGSAQTANTCPAVRYSRRLGQTLLTPGIPRTAVIGDTIDLTASNSFRMIQMRGPGMKPVRPREWISRGQVLELTFEKEGIYTFVLHGDDGRRRRFRTRVLTECS